jgi:hypothetical protein
MLVQTVSEINIYLIFSGELDNAHDDAISSQRNLEVMYF